ncbi:MAG: tetratricopeptide repeat protein [Candidatus Longimicrobiales bacterium M2_2A_002]
MKIRLWMTALAVLAAAACGEQQEGQRVELGEEEQAAENQQGRASWPYELEAQVDSANLEYMNEQYQASADRYRALTEEYPEIGTLWFGLYMAENALGNEETAQEALAKANELAPGLGPMHEQIESGSMGDAMQGQMPAGHPPLDSVNPEDAPPLGGEGG